MFALLMIEVIVLLGVSRLAGKDRQASVFFGILNVGNRISTLVLIGVGFYFLLWWAGWVK